MSRSSKLLPALAGLLMYEYLHMDNVTFVYVHIEFDCGAAYLVYVIRN